MEFELSFKPIEHQKSDYTSNQLGGFVEVYTEGSFPDLTEADVVLIGVPEFRGTETSGSASSLAKIRKEYYKLFRGTERLRIADLGDILIGEKTTDTFHLLAEALLECHRRGLFAFIVGGGQDATFAQYRSCVQLQKMVNLVSVDARFDFGLNTDDLNAYSYLSKIIQDEPNFLFNFSNIGYQSFLVPQEGISLIDKLYFDAHRLGVVRNEIEEVEPVLRNADILSVDISCVRLSDAPANFAGSPNGFSGEEICKIMRYAGLSGRLSYLGVYEYEFSSDSNDQTAKLIAQMMWYFLEGHFNRIKRLTPNEEDFMKYHVSMRDGEYDAIFYKNKQLDKWWMEIPLIGEQAEHFKDHFFIPCSYRDYQIASQGELPDRWWKAFQKMN